MRKILLCLPLTAASCAGPGALPPAPPASPAPARAEAVPPAQPPAPPPVRRVPPEEWPVLADDLDADSLARAAERNKAYLKGLGDAPIQVGDRVVGPKALIETGEAVLALKREGLPPAEFTERLKKDFDLFRIQGGSQPPGAFFSSYYLPVLEASTACQGAFAFPIYRKPPDLVEADLGAFNPKWKGETLVGRMTPEGRFVPYFDRGAVDVRGALAGKGLEIACLKGAFERLDLHIQGSGLLELPDKTLKLARFSATNALPYRSVGLALAGSGAVRREELDRARLRQYLAEHPEGEAWLLSQNPRYTFFELVDVPPDGEPFGRADQPLTAGRSIAVDPKFAPLGSLAFLRLETVQTDASGAFLGRSAMSRLAFCQDIGGAIQGPGRVDIYSGHGAQAFSQASKIWDPGELYLLLKRLPARQR